ncbi:MAG: SDR family oxidoreductase, partial [Spirochaetota bacterium]
NLHSAFLVNRAVLPHMMDEGWGRIINFGSRAAVKPGQRQAGYNVSKAGVVSLTSSVALEYRLKGITANAVLPSIVDTPANRKAMPDSDFSRWVKPEQIASLALFLCSEEAADINGAAIPVYGKV